MDGGKLGHTDAGDDAGGADGTGADADFEGTGTGCDEVPGAFFGDDVSGDDGTVGEVAEVFDDFDDAGGVSGGGVDEEGVCACFDEGLGAFEVFGSDADGGTAAHLAVGVFGGVGEEDGFFDIGTGDESGEGAIGVDEGEFFDAIFVEDAACFLKGGVGSGGDEAVMGGHDGGDEGVVIGEVADVAAGDHADEEFIFIDDGEAGEALLGHDLPDFADGLCFFDGEGFLDDGVLGSFDAGDHGGLFGDGAGSVDDSHAAFSGEGDGEFGFGDGIHRG